MNASVLVSRLHWVRYLAIGYIGIGFTLIEQSQWLLDMTRSWWM